MCLHDVYKLLWKGKIKEEDSNQAQTQSFHGNMFLGWVDHLYKKIKNKKVIRKAEMLSFIISSVAWFY